MKTVLSVRGRSAKANFQLWREVLQEFSVPAERTRAGDGPFEGFVEQSVIGDLPISRVTLGAMHLETTSSTIRSDPKQDRIGLLLKLGGSATGRQNGQDSIQKAGDLVVYDSSRPMIIYSTESNSTLIFEIPRRRFETALGPASLYSSLTVDGASAGGALAANFLKELVRVQDELTPATAARMASIGADLVTAALAERLARDVPRTIHSDVVVQRAKAHVASNLGDLTLNPEQIAAAAGVSLRRLQELFQERGRYIADWIWEQRLERASGILADPDRAHLPLGSIAYGCGFSNQAHFSTRFKRRFGLTPREYRVRAYERLAASDRWDPERQHLQIDDLRKI